MLASTAVRLALTLTSYSFMLDWLVIFCSGSSFRTTCSSLRRGFIPCHDGIWTCAIAFIGNARTHPETPLEKAQQCPLNSHAHTTHACLHKSISYMCIYVHYIYINIYIYIYIYIYICVLVHTIGLPFAIRSDRSPCA